MHVGGRANTRIRDTKKGVGGRVARHEGSRTAPKASAPGSGARRPWRRPPNSIRNRSSRGGSPGRSWRSRPRASPRRPGRSAASNLVPRAAHSGPRRAAGRYYAARTGTSARCCTPRTRWPTRRTGAATCRSPTSRAPSTRRGPGRVLACAGRRRGSAAAASAMSKGLYLNLHHQGVHFLRDALHFNHFGLGLLDEHGRRGLFATARFIV